MLARRIGLLLLVGAVASCTTSHYTIGDNQAGGSGGVGGTDALAGTTTGGEALGGADALTPGGDAAGGDSAGGAPDLGCPAACTRGCVGRLCEIDPLPDGSLPPCPAAFDCSVHCEAPGTCLGDVHCGDARSCIVNCTGENNCFGAINCDQVPDCQVVCSGTDACASVACPAEGRCAVTCNGTSSCAAGVTCGGGPCSVLCGGASSCQGALACQDSCGCDWQCAPGSACHDAPPTCPDGCASAAGCSSAGTGCRTCN